MNQLSAEDTMRIEAHVQSVLGARVRSLRLLIRDNGLVLQGQTHTYYSKQLAQQAVMEATQVPIWANEIYVY